MFFSRWRPFTLSVQKLCNGDPDRQMEIAILRMERYYIAFHKTSIS